MTASSLPVPAARPAASRLPGLRALVRKDLTEWRRGKRVWVVGIVVTLFMALTAANGAITAALVEVAPPEPGMPLPEISRDPLVNLGAAVGAQMFVLAAILAVASLVVGERQSGTLAWLASKPVSRGSIWVAKLVSASVALAVSAVLVPFAVTVAVVTVLYGPVDPAVVAMVTVGALGAVALYAALGLVLGVVLPGQPAVVAAALGIFALAPIVASVAGPVGQVLPTSILEWSIGLAMGAPVSWLTPAAWAVGMAALVGLGISRMRRLEL